MQEKDKNEMMSVDKVVNACYFIVEVQVKGSTQHL